MFKDDPRSAFNYVIAMGFLSGILAYYLATKIIYVLEYAGIL